MEEKQADLERVCKHAQNYRMNAPAIDVVKCTKPPTESCPYVSGFNEVDVCMKFYNARKDTEKSKQG
jgi:hypothetical protein